MLLKVYKSRVWIMLFMLLPFIGKAQLPPNLPTGWEFTLNPTSATYAIPTTVAFNGVDALQAGDWIGAFYDDAGVLKCAGAVEWTGTENIALVAFGHDELEPVKNGFYENELVQWKFYRSATSTEECVKAFDALSAEFYWTNGDLDEVASFGPCEIICEQSFNFTAGWNWISFNVLPELADLNSVLGNGYTNGDFIQTAGGTAQFYEGYGWYGATLSEIDPDKMYQLKLTSASSITVVGNCVDVADPIDLAAGWSWIGYKPQQPSEINVALGSLTPTNGDFIQTAGGTAQFYEGYGWYGATLS
ncbi:MAG: hypothetical protein EOM06_12415, partial [Sphingobacteriia bacterium]|nr:hypothetical protein [Sphingobacteriia bacterium]